MAHVAAKPKNLASQVRQLLEEGLAIGGISAKVSTESVKGTKLTRVLIAAAGFRSLRPSERQDLVWRILGASLNHEEQLRISTVLTLTPDEIAGKW
jgi:hypothetical protein